MTVYNYNYADALLDFLGEGVMLRPVASCPVCDELYPGADFAVDKACAWDLIPHLNDTHEWTREQIAAWLRTLPIDLTVTVPKEYDR